VFEVPRLVVTTDCRRVRHEFLNFIWADWAIQAAREEKDPKGEVRKKDDDCLDGLMYLMQAGEDASDFGVWSNKQLSEKVYIPEVSTSSTGY